MHPNGTRSNRRANPGDRPSFAPTTGHYIALEAS